MKKETDELENRITQLRKGILELAIMGALYHQSHYGYSLVRLMSRDGALSLKEGTIYPILSRLNREGLVNAHWVESSQGPPRKYYALAKDGRCQYEALIQEFEQLVDLVRESGQKSRYPKDEKKEKLNVSKESENE
jgi:PadR family transcriptional regulator PadR